MQTDLLLDKEDTYPSTTLLKTSEKKGFQECIYIRKLSIKRIAFSLWFQTNVLLINIS